MSFFNKNLFKLFIIFLLIFAVFARFDSWNENSRLDLTRAIVDEGRFTIDTYVNNTGDRAYYNSHYYSDKFPGASFTAIPPYFIYKYVFGNPPIETDLNNSDQENSYLFMVFFIIFFTSALFSALTVVLVYKVASFFTKKISHKYLAAIAYGLGTIALNNAGLFTDYAISTFFLFFSFYILYESFQNKQFSRKSIIIAGFLLGLAVMTSPLIMFVFLALGGYLLAKKFYLRFIYYTVPAILIILFVALIYNFAIFGSFDAGYNNSDEDIFNFYSKSFSIEDASCLKVYNTGGFLKRSYHDFLNLPRFCEIDLFLEYAEGIPFPISERTSVGDHFSLLESQNMKYLFQRVYNYNGQNLNYSFMFVQEDEIIKVFFYPTNFNVLTKTHDLNLSQNNYSFLDYQDQSLHTVFCPFDKRKINTSLACYKTLLLGNKRLLIFEREYLFINSSTDGNKTLLHFKFSSTMPDIDNPTPLLMLKLFVYPYRGLLFFSPILIFSFIGLFFMARKHPLLTLLIVLSFLFFLFAHAKLSIWWGGSSFGPKHLMPVIPFLMIPLIFAMKKINMKVVLTVLLISIIINLAGIQVLEQDVLEVSDSVFLRENVLSQTYSWETLGNPLVTHYFPLFMEQGPNSILLERISGHNFIPFLNLIILIVVSLTIIFGFRFKNNEFK